MAELFPKHKLVADHYLANGFNAMQAYYEVYGRDKVEPRYVYHILKRPEVKEYIEERRQEIYDSLNIDARRVMSEIAEIAFQNAGGNVSTTEKLRALELLSKNLNLQMNKTENSGVIEIQLVED